METLTINLFDPCMTPIHRCGAGGLACALEYLKRKGIQVRGSYEVHPTQIKMRFANLSHFLQDVFKHTYSIRNGIIDFPAIQDPNITDKTRQVFTDLLSSTLLHHTQAMQKDGQAERRAENKEAKKKAEEEGSEFVKKKKPKGIQEKVISYANQKGWKVISDAVANRELVKMNCYVIPWFGNLHGTREWTYNEQKADLALCLYFVLQGAALFYLQQDTSLRQEIGVDSKGGRDGFALIVPDVINLKQFADRRPCGSLSPSDTREYVRCGLGDVAIRAWAQLERDEDEGQTCQAIYTYHVVLKQQVSRTHVLEVPYSVLKSTDIKTQHLHLTRSLLYEALLREDDPAKVKPDTPKKQKRVKGEKKVAKQDKTIEKKAPVPEEEIYNSLARPALALIFSNLSQNKPFYTGFYRFAPNKESLKRLSRPSLRKVLIEMTQTLADDDPLGILIVAIHEAMAAHFAKAARTIRGLKKLGPKEKMPAGEFSKRAGNLVQRWNIALNQAGGQVQVMSVLAQILATNSPTLCANRNLLLGTLMDKTCWQNIKSVAVIAIATYPKKNEDEKEIDLSASEE